MQEDRNILFDFGEVLFRRNPRSKNIRIKIHPVKGIVVSVPNYCSIDRAINFVIEKEIWIRKSLEKVSETKDKLTVFTEETKFKTHSRQLILAKHEKQSLRMEVNDRQLRILFPKTVNANHEKVQEFTRNSVIKVLKLEASNYLPDRTKELAKKHGLSVNEVKVRNNKTRWGSCSVHNNINLNIHLMRLPQELIDYVIYHELAHTKVRNHSAKYWLYLEKLLPGARRLDKKLSKYHLVYW